MKRLALIIALLLIPSTALPLGFKHTFIEKDQRLNWWGKAKFSHSVRNFSKIPMRVTVEAFDFRFEGSTIKLNDKVPWIKHTEAFTIYPNQRKELHYKVKPPGKRSAALCIVVLALPENRKTEGKGLAIGFRFSNLVLIKGRKIKEAAKVKIHDLKRAEAAVYLTLENLSSYPFMITGDIESKAAPFVIGQKILIPGSKRVIKIKGEARGETKVVIDTGDKKWLHGRRFYLP